jgi:hypothetical protein
MSLKAEQQSQVATVYEKAAADMRIPAPQRAAFARKAEWFRLLARLRAKKEAKAATEARKMNGRKLREDVRPLVENISKRGGE